MTIRELIARNNARFNNLTPESSPGPWDVSSDDTEDKDFSPDELHYLRKNNRMKRAERAIYLEAAAAAALPPESELRYNYPDSPGSIAWLRTQRRWNGYEAARRPEEERRLHIARRLYEADPAWVARQDARVARHNAEMAYADRVNREDQERREAQQQ
jgi:hypothetical protein